MNVIINGEERSVEGTASLAELLANLELPERRIAVELNKKVVRRSDWASVEVSEGDRVEIVHFVGGG